MRIATGARVGFVNREEEYLNEQKEDLWAWKANDSTDFNVQSAYIILKGEGQEEGAAMYEGFWRIKAQPSAHFTTWRVFEDKIASKINLVKRGKGVESNICNMCGEGEKTMSHLFCTCRIAWLVWSKCY